MSIIEDELSKLEISCKICRKIISLDINRKDKLISFKNHLRQGHNIGLNEYYLLKNEKICKFCKKNTGKIIVTKIDNKLEVNNFDLCDDRKCIDIRNKLNINSIEYVSIIENCSKEEALKIIHKRNSTPFYNNNHNNKGEYSLNQKTYSPRNIEHYLNKINPKTNEIYTVDEANYEITIIQCKIANKPRKKKRTTPNFISNLAGFEKVYGKDEGKIQYDSFCNKSLKKNKNITTSATIIYSLDWYKFIYGTIDGEKAYIHRQNYLDFIESSAYYRMVLNPDSVERFFEKKYSKSPLASFMANKLFSEVYLRLQQYINLEEYDIWFEALNNEKVICGEDGRFWYDFCMRSKDQKTFRKIIEFNGTYWHSSDECKKKDIIKINQAKKYNYECFIIENADDSGPKGREARKIAVEQCIEFLIGDIINESNTKNKIK